MKSILFSAYQQPINWQFIGLMCLDALGLIIILGCTVYDIHLLWNEEMHYNYKGSPSMFSSLMSFENDDNGNHGSIFWWFSGHAIQTIGLLYLIAHAALMQKYHALEHIGMILLLIGPAINMYSCINYSTESVLGKSPSGDAFGFMFNVTNMESVPFENERVNHNHNGYNMQQLCTEIVEFVGILILNGSIYLEHYPSRFNEDYIILIIDVIGFAVLQVAAMAEFDYSRDNSTPTFAELTSGMQIEAGGSPTQGIPLSGYYPYTTRVFPYRLNFRYDLSHCADGIGLLMLTAVSFAQYASKQDERLKLELYGDGDDQDKHCSGDGKSPATPDAVQSHSKLVTAGKGDSHSSDSSSWGGRLKRFRNRIGGAHSAEADSIHSIGSEDSADMNPELTINLLHRIEEGDMENSSFVDAVALENGTNEDGIADKKGGRFPDMYIATNVNLPSDPVFLPFGDSGEHSRLDSGPPSNTPTVPPSPSKYIYNSKKQPFDFQVRVSEPPTGPTSLSSQSAFVSHRTGYHNTENKSPTGSSSSRTAWSASASASSPNNSVLQNHHKSQTSSPATGPTSLWQFITGTNEAIDSPSNIASSKARAGKTSMPSSVDNSRSSSPQTLSHKHYR